MHELPATPITDAPPAWTGYGATPSRPAGAPLPPFSSVPSAHAALITGEQLTAHLQRPDSWRSLPDGRPLRLCADAIEYIGDDFGGYEPGSLRSAMRVLYFATRTPEQMDALWVPPPLPPAEVAEGVLRTAEPVGLAFRLRELQMEISRWGRETFAPCAHMGVRRLALDLWINVVDRIPVPAEKKSPEPEADPTGSLEACGKATSGSSAGTSPEAMPADTASCAAPISSPSAMPSSAGPPSTATPSSRRPKSSSDSPPQDG